MIFEREWLMGRVTGKRRSRVRGRSFCQRRKKTPDNLDQPICRSATLTSSSRAVTMDIARETATWDQLQERYYRKRELYDMGWTQEKLDLSEYLSAIHPAVHFYGFLRISMNFCVVLCCLFVRTLALCFAVVSETRISFLLHIHTSQRCSFCTFSAL